MVSYTELQRCRKRIPKSVFGSLDGLSAEETAMILQDRLAGGGILSTLDFSQAYDRMSPDISKAFLTSLGWDEGFCSVWASAWSAQQRWLQWQDTTLSEPLTALDATPVPTRPLGVVLLNRFRMQTCRSLSWPASSAFAGGLHGRSYCGLAVLGSD